MSMKSIRLISLGVLLFLSVGILVGVKGVTNALAKSPNETPEPACISCHENQYYMYDSGCWYCITESRDRCVNCHGGDGDSLNEQEAHTGLISNPLGHGSDHCATCHGEDTDELVQELISHTGYHESLENVPYVSDVPVTDAFPEQYQSFDEVRGNLWLVPTAMVLVVFCLAFLIRVI